MAQKLWNDEIDKTVDWGGDSSTDSLPVSGKFVQKFIKDSLASKFGYLHYNSDTKKYQVFADEADFILWNSDPATNANLLLATFDAPAPASIKVDMITELSNTVLSSKTGNVITFKYIVSDSAGSPITEAVTVRLQITNNGITQTYTFPYEVDYKNYKEGTVKDINIDNYLKPGVNTITLNFTGNTTQATAVASVRYTVVELSIKSSWDNTVAQKYDDLLDPELLFDIDKGNALHIPYVASGQGTKYIEIYINGKRLGIDGPKNPGGGLNFGDVLGGQQEISSIMDIFLSQEDGTLNEYFVEGKNIIQFRIFIVSDEQEFYSNTLYYEFVVQNVHSSEDIVCILYKQELDDVFETGKVIEFNTTQYNSTSFDYSLYSSTGKASTLSFDLVKRPENEGELSQHIATLQQKLSSGEVKKFEYSFLDYGVIDLTVTTDLTNASGIPLDTLHVIINVEKAAYQISVKAGNDRSINFEALNRSNSEPNPEIWQSGAVKADFDHIYWNDSAGWDGKSLVLNNGAMCSIPYNFFGSSNTNGFTIEITFEMINVQDENAVMAKFEAPGEKSGFVMTASEAKLTDGSGKSVHTKYNANTKIKLAFIVNPYDRTNNFDPSYTGAQEYKNCSWIIVNGILDKAEEYSGTIVWNSVNQDAARLVLGNADGKAGIKIYSIRYYRVPLSLDDELTNWIAETDDIIKNFEKNNIQDESGNVALDIVKNMIPTVILYGNIERFNGIDPITEGKKANMQFDMEFYDPTDPERDFYARGCWFSNQGTSSMFYPIRNLRPYFSKTRDKKSLEDSADYYTEVYLAGNFTHGQVTDESTLKHFYTNAKTCATSVKNVQYHRCYNETQAKKLEAEGTQIFYREGNDFYPCKIGVNAPKGYGPIIDKSNGGWYIQGYRAIKPYGTGTDDYWKFLKDLRLSGVKIFEVSGEEEVENPIDGTKYKVKKFEQVKGKKALDENKQYYLQQGVWRQYHKSGYTDRWTFKADYAESTMTQNAGAARLWGDCMKNVQIGGKYECRTDAQTEVGKLVTADDERIDIRTSCDGKPIVGFCCPLEYEEDGITPKMEDGKRVYGAPIFIGLYNIMTDKSSTKLFGFEDIYDENGKKIYKADRTECWECLSNATEFPQGLSVACDTDIANTSAKKRSLWNEYEARWPDVGEYAHTHNIESMWRFINFCKPAVNYWVGTKSGGAVDGYTQSPYSLIDPEKYEEYWNMQPRPTVYTEIYESGNVEYEEYRAETIDDWYSMRGLLFEYQNDFDYDRVWKELSGKRIEGNIYKGKVATFDAKYGQFTVDIQFDEEKADDPTTGAVIFDPEDPVEDPELYNATFIRNSSCAEDYYVDVYLTQSGSRYTYVDEHGNTVQYTGESIDRDAYERNSKGESFAGKTYMEYFSEKKYDYFHIPRLAAYYIYLMRFAAADQFVKNSMLTTEDGKHYYYINYDNDTILGTRNDGNLVFHWSVNRDTYDYEKNSFCFAGPKSVLWNLLEMDADFMAQVQIVDNAMYASRVLSAPIALDMFNNKQEGSWGERMYNINEKYKYLSQWTGSDAKYLAFIHGSANQFRSWFVENRFNYYDSLWESGEYSTTGIQLRMDTMNTDKTSPIFNITAARQNKFILANSDGGYKDVPAWKITLNQGETRPWIALYPIYGNSSPWQLYGCDKIEVLDFRPSIGIFDIQGISFVVDGNNWMAKDKKGTLMTKLLFGTSDEFRATPMFRYTNITDEPVVLLKVTLSSTYSYNTTQDLLYDDTLIEREGNNGNWTYKSISGNQVDLPIVTLQPNEYYDSVTQIQSADVTKTPYEQLPVTKCNIDSIGSLGELYSLEEIDIRNCFNDASPLNASLDLTGLNNLHIYRAIGSSITEFEPAEGAILNEVSLPINRVNRIILNNVTFRKAENQEAPTFKYEPDYALTELVFNNILFGDEESKIDFVEFINKWIASHKDMNPAFNPKTLSLTLTGVNLEDVDVQWLIDLKQLNLVSFTGTVMVKGTGDNGKLTEAEYQTLNELYADERPFESTSALRFNAQKAVYWSVEGNEEIVTNETALTWGNNNVQSSAKRVKKYYTMLHGNKLGFKITQFPLNTSGEMQYYKFDYIDNTGNWISAPNGNATDFANGIYKLNSRGWNLLLQPKMSGMSIFEANLANDDSVNVTRKIAIYPVNSNRQKTVSDNDTLFVEINPAKLPEKLILSHDDEELTKTGSINIQVTLEDGSVVNKDCDIYKFDIRDHLKEFKIDILYSNAEDVTVESSGVAKVALYNSGTTNGSLDTYENNTVSIIERKVGNNVFHAEIGEENGKRSGGSFKIAGKVNPTNVSQDILIDITMKTGLQDKHRLVILRVNVITQKPNGVRFGEMEGATISTVVDNNSTQIPMLTYNKPITEDLLIPIEPYNTNGTKINLPIKSAKIESYPDSISIFENAVIEIDENNNCFIKLPINDSSALNLSYDYEEEYLITGTFGYEFGDWENHNSFTFSFKFKLDISIIYPNKFKAVFDDDLSTELDDSQHGLVINNRDNASKNIRIDLIPYNTEFDDPITIDLDSANVSVKMFNNNSVLVGGNNIEDFITYNIDNSNPSKPFIDFTLNKHKIGDQSFDTVQEAFGEISINAEYKNTKNATIKVSTTIPFKSIQSVAYCNKIDDCEPYQIDGEWCKWYLVDSDNQYYKINSDIVQTLLDANVINKLVGVAKRVNYGWDDENLYNDDPNKKFQFNAEQNGDEYHNACMYWSENPNICVNGINNKNYKTTNVKNIYYRALCLPLMNWKYSDELLEQLGYDKNETYDTITELEIVLNANKVSGFYVPSPRISAITIDGNFRSPELENIFGKREEFINVFNNLNRQSLHTNSLNTVNGINLRKTDINSPWSDNRLNTATGRWVECSVIDSRNSTKHLIENILKLKDTKTKPIFNNKTFAKNSSYNQYLSGILNTWFHFEIFNPKVDENYPEIDNSKIKCYIPSPYELNHMLLKDQKGIVNKDNIFILSEEGVFDTFADIDHFLTSQLSDKINVNNTFAHIFNVKTINEVYGSFNDYFVSFSSVDFNEKTRPFIGSLALVKTPLKNTGTPGNVGVTEWHIGSSGSYGPDSPPKAVSPQSPSIPAVTSSTTARDNYFGASNGSNRGLWIPLLIVD